MAGGLRFAFYWRVSTEDHQDPVTSRARQLRRALATIGGEGRIVVEFSDVGKSRSMSPFLRPGSAAPLEALTDPDRGFDGVVLGSHERAFSGNQYSLVAPLLALHGVPLSMPELGGAVDPAIDTIEELMDLLGILARREVIRARQRATNAMTVQVAAPGCAPSSPTTSRRRSLNLESSQFVDQARCLPTTSALSWTRQT